MILKVNRSNLFVLGCLLFVLTLPFPIPINNIAIAFLLVGWILHSSIKEKIENFKTNWRGYLIFALFFAYGFSLLYTTNLHEGFGKLETKLSLIAISLVVFSSTLRKEDVVKILRFFTYSNLLLGVVLVLIAYGRYLKGENINTLFYHELTAPLGLHAIYLAIYLCIGVFVLLFESDLKMSLYFRGLLLFLSLWLIVMLSALLVLVFLTLAFALVILVFLYKRIGATRALAAAVGFILVLLTLTFLAPRTRDKITQISRLDYKMEDPDSAWNTITLRLAIWQCSLPVTIKEPFFGVGIGDENIVLQTSYQKFNFKEGIRCNYNTHNQYLSTCIAIGFVGLFILLALIGAPTIYALKQKDWLLLGFLALMAFSFLTENILSVQKGTVFFSFFYALLLKKKDEILLEKSSFA